VLLPSGVPENQVARVEEQVELSVVARPESGPEAERVFVQPMPIEEGIGSEGAAAVVAHPAQGPAHETLEVQLAGQRVLVADAGRSGSWPGRTGGRAPRQREGRRAELRVAVALARQPAGRGRRRGRNRSGDRGRLGLRRGRRRSYDRRGFGLGRGRGCWSGRPGPAWAQALVAVPARALARAEVACRRGDRRGRRRQRRDALQRDVAADGWHRKFVALPAVDDLEAERGERAAPFHVTSLRTSTFPRPFFFLKSIHIKVSPGATLMGRSSPWGTVP